MGFCLSVLKKDYKLYIVIDWFHAVFGTLWWVFVYFKVFVLVLWECFCTFQGASIVLNVFVFCTFLGTLACCAIHSLWLILCTLWCRYLFVCHWVCFLCMFFVYVFCVINIGIMECIRTWNILSFHFKHQRQCNVVMHTMVKAACHVIPS